MDGVVFYVGKGLHRKRCKLPIFERAHSTSRRSAWWRNVAKDGYSVEIMAMCINDQSAIDLEVGLIAMYGRRDLGLGSLVNFTDGGEGRAGAVYTEEMRRQRSERIMGDKHPNWGKPLSDATKLKKSIALSGSNHHLYGTKLPDTWKQNISKGKMGSKNPWFGRPTPIAKRVRNVVTGIEYDTICCAAISENMTPGRLYSALGGTRRNTTHLELIV